MQAPATSRLDSADQSFLQPSMRLDKFEEPENTADLQRMARQWVPQHQQAAQQTTQRDVIHFSESEATGVWVGGPYLTRLGVCTATDACDPDSIRCANADRAELSTLLPANPAMTCVVKAASVMPVTSAAFRHCYIGYFRAENSAHKQASSSYLQEASAEKFGPPRSSRAGHKYRARLCRNSNSNSSKGLENLP